MIFYILNVALILAGCLVFYKLLLQKETFFPLNRFILLGCLALSFSLPLIPVPQAWSFRKAPEVATIQTVPVVQPTTVTQPASTPAVKPKVNLQPVNTIDKAATNFFTDLPVAKLLFWGYWLGVAIFGINFLVQLITLLVRVYARPVIQDGRYRIVELSGNQAPCSFGNNIFINPEKYEWETYSQILLHEKVHIQQGHSYDILLAELALIFQWFNPFAWMYRKAMEDNLEFLTDNELLEHKEVERSSYQLSLVKVSAPHFPLNLTTNYNQSILKKRLIMMNAKKSNVNTTWKYLFIVPLLMLFVSILNEPVAFGKTTTTKATDKLNLNETFAYEGYWFATIKEDKITFRFERDDEHKNNNNTTFPLTDFKTLPRDAEGNFSLTRDAGAMNFTGKFNGNMGMGRYKFVPDQGYAAYLKKEGIVLDEEKDLVVFFMIDISKSYIKMLKDEGYDNIKKDDVIPLAALKVDAAYIRSLKAAGYNDVSLKDLIPLKALDVDAAYIADIKKSGVKITTDKLVALKAQGIDGDFIKNNMDVKTDIKLDKINADINVNPRINTNINTNVNTDVNVNDKGSKGPKGAKGNKDSDDDEELAKLGKVLAKKALNITPEFAKALRETGIEIDDEDLFGLKSLNVTPEFIKAIQAIGFTKITAEEAISLKALGITAEDVNAYKKIGFTNPKIDDVLSAKAMGVTPEYILAMRKKGSNFSTIQKYIEFKALMFGIDAIK